MGWEGRRGLWRSELAGGRWEWVLGREGCALSKLWSSKGWLYTSTVSNYFSSRFHLAVHFKAARDLHFKRHMILTAPASVLLAAHLLYTAFILFGHPQLDYQFHHGLQEVCNAFYEYLFHC